MNRQRADAFKVGFLLKLAELGVTPDAFFKRALIGDIAALGAGAITGGADVLGKGLAMGSGALESAAHMGVIAPAALGLVAGGADAMLSAPGGHDIDMLRKAELLAQYDRLTNEIKERTQRRSLVNAGH